MIPLSILCALLVVALIYRERAHDRQTATREKEWALERGALLTRIQHPEIVVGQAQHTEVPDTELLTKDEDDIDLVGTVQMNGTPDA